jgi:hypothetical protein
VRPRRDGGAKRVDQALATGTFADVDRMCEHTDYSKRDEEGGNPQRHSDAVWNYDALFGEITC